jgi:hypothetical protein
MVVVLLLVRVGRPVRPPPRARGPRAGWSS